MAYAFAGFGLILLIVGSESVLRSGVKLSRLVGLPPLLIGLLIVLPAISAPEMAVSLQAAARGAPELVLGTVVGCNIVNLLLILGLGALLRPVPVSLKIVLRDGGMLVASSIVLLLLVKNGHISRHSGALLLGGFAVYLAVSVFTDWRRPSPDIGTDPRIAIGAGREVAPAMNAILLLFGLVCLYFGGRYIVDGGLTVARIYRLPQAIIGLTLVAIGSSLPELATMIAASLRGHRGSAACNLIGASIFNILFVLGLTAAIHPLAISRQVAGVDIAIMTGAAVLLPLLLSSRWRLTRIQGALLVLSYLAYLGFVAWRQNLLPMGGFGIG